MVLAGAFILEAGIRSGRNHIAYSDMDAILVISFVATPILLMGASLLVLGAKQKRLQAVILTLLLGILIAGGTRMRFTSERQSWNAFTQGRKW